MTSRFSPRELREERLAWWIGKSIGVVLLAVLFLWHWWAGAIYLVLALCDDNSYPR